MRATLSYSLLRLLLFLAAVLILALLGLHGFTLLIVAALITAIVSIPLLSRQRNEMASSLARRVNRFSSRLDAGTRAEDDDKCGDLQSVSQPTAGGKQP